MADVRAEGVAVDVGGLANDLVADVLVADNGVSGLNSLQDSGRVGDCLDGWRLRDKSLAMDCGESWDGRDGWNGGNCWSGQD